MPRPTPRAATAVPSLAGLPLAGCVPVSVSRTERPELPYEFQVVNTDVVNAFAVPGGFVYMNRGLLEASHDMAEVTGE